MSTGTPAGYRAALRHEVEAIRGRWVWYLALGIALIVLGTIALGVPYIATKAAVLTFGIMLITSGLLQGVGAFYTRDWSGFFLVLLLGVLSFVAGLFVLKRPGMAAAALTILFGSFLLVGGLFKLVAALTYRFPQWGWMALSGVLGILLGLYVWSEAQELTPYLLGILLAVELIFDGWMWVALSLAMRRLGSRLSERLGAPSA